jgi:hypothetical protein
MYLRKAAQCFRRADDAGLRARAEAQLQALGLCRRLRLKLAKKGSDYAYGDESALLQPHDEVEAAPVLSRCIRTRLYSQAMRLSLLLSEVVPDPGYFRVEVHAKLERLYSTL